MHCRGDAGPHVSRPAGRAGPETRAVSWTTRAPPSPSCCCPSRSPWPEPWLLLPVDVPGVPILVPIGGRLAGPRELALLAFLGESLHCRTCCSESVRACRCCLARSASLFCGTAVSRRLLRLDRPDAPSRAWGSPGQPGAPARARGMCRNLVPQPRSLAALYRGVDWLGQGRAARETPPLWHFPDLSSSLPHSDPFYGGLDGVLMPLMLTQHNCWTPKDGHVHPQPGASFSSMCTRSTLCWSCSRHSEHSLNAPPPPFPCPCFALP